MEQCNLKNQIWFFKYNFYKIYVAFTYYKILSECLFYFLVYKIWKCVLISLRFYLSFQTPHQLAFQLSVICSLLVGYFQCQPDWLGDLLFLLCFAFLALPFLPSFLPFIYLPTHWLSRSSGSSCTHTDNIGKESCKGKNLGLSFLIRAELSRAKEKTQVYLELQLGIQSVMKKEVHVREVITWAFHGLIMNQLIPVWECVAWCGHCLNSLKPYTI